MLTAGDIEFEPNRQKIWMFNPHCVAMIAGDATLQYEICEKTQLGLKAAAAGTEPYVREVAVTYSKHFEAVRRAHAEQTFLAPLGLDTDEFLKRQHEMSPQLVDELAHKMQFNEIDAETIVCGVDALAAHLYLVKDPGHVSDQSGIGFVAIGIGANHAQSQFMFSRYDYDWSFERALLLTYVAKKRAETAPGVGPYTDLFLIGPYPSVYQVVPSEEQVQLQKIYGDLSQKVGRAEGEARMEIEKFRAEWLRKKQQQQQQAGQQGQPPSASPPTANGGKKP